MSRIANLFSPPLGLERSSLRSTLLGRVLVLGSLPSARRMADDLEAEGFESFVPGWTDEQLPSVLDPEAGRCLQEMLSAFMREAKGDSQQTSGLTFYLHPGLSAWADRPELPSVGSQCGFQVIAPSSRVLTLFGNKLNLLHEAESVGIPNLVIAPSDPIHSLREIEVFIERQKLRFPFILKSAKGGARLGITAIQDAQELEAKLPLWIEQLRRGCGEVILFCERYLEGARQVSVPFVRFLDGRSEIFPFVDISLQCRHRRVAEFCPAEGLDATVEKQLRNWTLALADRVGFVGAGTLEFLVDSSRPYLVGGAARLDPSFHLWEQIAGTCAVAWQIAAMQGGSGTSRPEAKPSKWKTTVGLRMYAEDPILQLPQPGTVREVSDVRQWSFPSALAELELVVEPGQQIGPSEQGLVGVLWVSAQSRAQAVITARGVLDELWIAGSLQTNERFLSELLLHPWVREGIFHTAFIDEEFLPALRPPAELSRLFASVLLHCDSEAQREPVPGERWAVGDQWVKPDWNAIEWVEGPSFWSESGGAGVSGRIRVPDGRALRVCAFPLSDSKWQVRLGGWVMMTRRVPPKGSAKSGARPRLSSLIPGRVHSILYRNGATVPAHEPLLVIESLGILIPHAVPVEVQIQRWKVAAEDRVAAGQELAEFEILSK